MGINWELGMMIWSFPLVIIHFRLGFSWNKPSIFGGTPPFFRKPPCGSRCVSKMAIEAWNSMKLRGVEHQTHGSYGIFVSTSVDFTGKKPPWNAMELTVALTIKSVGCLRRTSSNNSSGSFWNRKKMRIIWNYLGLYGISMEFQSKIYQKNAWFPLVSWSTYIYISGLEHVFHFPLIIPTDWTLVLSEGSTSNQRFTSNVVPLQFYFLVSKVTKYRYIYLP